MSEKNNLNSDFRSVGKIRRAHGIRGELFLISFSKSFDWMEDIKEANLLRREANAEGEVSEVLHKFKIKKAKDHKVGRILKLEGMNDRNLAESFEGSLFQVPNTIFDNAENEDFYLLELEGFQLVDPAGNELAKITGFSTNNAQDLLLVTNDDGEFQVPYVKEWIEQLDFANQKVVINLPEGLLSND